MSDDYKLCEFRVAVDTREQAPWSFTGFRTDASQGRRPLIIQTVTATLASGDYSIEGLEVEVSIERKSVADFYGTILADRERFERELTRLQAMCEAGGHAQVVCEGDYLDLAQLPNPHGRYTDAELSVKRKVAFRSVIAWRQRFPLVHWERMPSRREAEQYAFRVLERFWNERVRREKQRERTEGAGQ